MRKAVFTVALAFGATSASGADSMLSEAAFLGEMPVVLTASRIAQSPLDAPAPVTVIDREMIRASGFTEIHDLFRLVPGFQVADWPEGPPVVTNHGLGSAYPKRILVLVDGRSVLDPFRGSVNWQGLPLRVEDIDRIEVVRGPNQASYGANAFDGVINIFTRPPALDHGVGAVVTGGRRDIGEGYLRLGGGDGILDWRVSVSARQATNFRDLQRTNYDWREEIDRKTLNSQISYRPNVSDEWRAQLGLSQGGNAIGSSTIDYTQPYRDTRFESHFLQLGWRRSYAAASEISLQYYHFDREERDAFDYMASDPVAAPVAFIPVDLGLEMRRDDIEFQQRHAFSPALSGVWGTGLRRDEVKSPHDLYGLGWVGGYQWQLFGNLDWQVAPKWLLHAGGMLEKHYNTGALLSPRLAANYTISPGHAIRLSGGRGYRAPTIFEASSYEVYAYSGGIADIGYWSHDEVKPEKVDFLELGYVGRAERLGLQWDARVFVNHFDRLINNQSCVLDPEVQDRPGGKVAPDCAFDPPPGYERPLGFDGKSWLRPDLGLSGTSSRFGHYKAYVFGNYGSVRMKGADLSLDWHHRDLGRFVFSHALIMITASPDADRDAHVSAPQHSSSLLWMRSWPWGINTSIGFYRIGEFKWPSDGDVQPAYRRWDVKLAKRLGKSGSEDEVSFTLQNLNAEHTEFDDYMVERRAFATLRLSW